MGGGAAEGSGSGAVARPRAGRERPLRLAHDPESRLHRVLSRGLDDGLSGHAARSPASDAGAGGGLDAQLDRGARAGGERASQVAATCDSRRDVADVLEVPDADRPGTGAAIEPEAIRRVAVVLELDLEFPSLTAVRLPAAGLPP